MYRDFSQRCKNDAEFVKLNTRDKFAYYHRNSPNVVNKFPVIIRYMIETGQFHPKAMRQYIKKLKASPYKTEEEYCERNADYIKYLYMNTHVRYDTKEANRLWTDSKLMLMDELKDFKDRLDEHRKKTEDMKAVNAYERREELKNQIKNMSQLRDDQPASKINK